MNDNHEFVWGTATSAFQVEGAAFKDGKGASIWDAFTEIPGRIANGDNAQVACDMFHKFPEDIKLMQELGVNAYRFSLAWTRIMPDGKGDINQAGIAYYHRLIDCLLENGITPWVTLYHWDLPLALQLEDDGWLNPEIAEHFARYAKICFQEFGGKVKNWITFNEPWCSAILGHGLGCFAPGRTSNDEPYVAGHNLLRAHALAVKKFRAGDYSGAIGITNNCDWREPLTDTDADKAAAQLSLEFFYGWFTDPVVFGDYPQVMKDKLGERLPEFTAEEKSLLKGSSDFLGLNHYTTLYATATKPENYTLDAHGNGGISEDQGVFLVADSEWERTAYNWSIVPWGFRKMLGWIAARYPGLPVYVTENGAAETPSEDKITADPLRCKLLTGYLENLKLAKDEDGVPVRGYFCWSLLDNFEWSLGYSLCFGLVHCDFATLKRTPKDSFYLYQKTIAAW